jgi:hypothetical protein
MDLRQIFQRLDAPFGFHQASQHRANDRAADGAKRCGLPATGQKHADDQTNCDKH